jgi:hypothetical protein
MKQTYVIRQSGGIVGLLMWCFDEQKAFVMTWTLGRDVPTRRLMEMELGTAMIVGNAGIQSILSCLDETICGGKPR